MLLAQRSESIDQKEWRRGLELIEKGEYWAAHEALEVVWLGEPDGATRDAVQSLIQFAAAAHKLEQTRRGRSPESMQRGMEKLISRAMRLIESSDGARPSWNVDALREALEELDEVRRAWCRHGSVDRAGQRADEIARRLTAELAS